MAWLRRLGLAAILGCGSAHAAESAPPVKLASPRITEASGIAASIRHPNAWWIVNDSGSPPELHLAGGDGADLGTVTLRHAQNRDWEDLACFEWKGRPYLLVADTGDNASRHPSCMLHIVPEPAIGRDGRLLPGNVAAAWKIEFRYEDGPRDCEAVAVDARAGIVLLLSKRTRPPALYRLPLVPESPAPQVAKRIATVRTASPGGQLLPFGGQPTGMDISADGNSAAILTYDGWFHVTRGTSGAWEEAFAKHAVWKGPHRLIQAEAISFGGDVVAITHEGLHPRLAWFRPGSPASNETPVSGPPQFREPTLEIEHRPGHP